MTTALTIGNQNALGLLLKSQLKAFQSLLPKVATPERMARLFLDATARTPKLLQCTPESMTKAMIDCARMGLEPVGKGGVWLVPFGREVVAITDYRGETTLAYRSGFVKAVHTLCIYQNERPKFHHAVVDGVERVDHEPMSLASEEERGPFIGVYCAVELMTGGKVYAVLSKERVEHYRGKSKAANSKDGPWVNDFDAMARKTAIKRAMNEVPQSSEYRALIANEEAREYGEPEPFPLEGFTIDVVSEPVEPENKSKAIVAEAIESAKQDPRHVQTTASKAQVDSLFALAERNDLRTDLETWIERDGLAPDSLTDSDVRELTQRLAEKAMGKE